MKPEEEEQGGRGEGRSKGESFSFFQGSRNLCVTVPNHMTWGASFDFTSKIWVTPITGHVGLR